MSPSLSSHLMVAAQLAGVGLAVVPLPGPARGPAMALAVCAAGALLAVWTLAHNKIGNFGIYPEPRQRAVLVTTGPYAYVRHPMYSSLILVTIGLAAFNGGWLNLLGLVTVIGAVLCKARREEKLLAERFPEYAGYRARVGMVLPRVHRTSSSPAGPGR